MLSDRKNPAKLKVARTRPLRAAVTALKQATATIPASTQLTGTGSAPNAAIARQVSIGACEPWRERHATADEPENRWRALAREREPDVCASQPS